MKTTPPRICIANHKGGVGKTTSTVTIADALAREKKRVLVIDMDPQTNLTQFLIGKEVIPEITMASLLSARESEAAALLSKGIIDKTSVPGVSILPSSLSLEYVSNEMRNSALTSPAMYLRRRLAHLEDRFDVILLDCPPSLGLMMMNALAASDYLIIPFLAGDRHGLTGVSNLIHSIEQIRDDSINPDLKTLGAIINGHDGRENAHEVTEAVIAQDFRILAKIPRSASTQKGALGGRTIIQEERTSKAAREWVRFSQELLTMIGNSSERRTRSAKAREVAHG